MKKSMRFSLVALIVMLAISVMSPDAWAKPGGGGRSSGSSRSSSWSKPSSPKVSTPKPAAKPSANYSKPTTATPANPASTYTKPSNPTAGKAVTSTSQVGGAVSKQRAKAALDSHRATQQKFTVPPKPTANPAATTVMTGRARSAGINNRDQYYTKRDDYWSNRSYTPPTYVYSSPSMFGNFDGLFLWMMLDSVQDAQMMNFYRGNASDPDMKAWREQAEKEAANNAELKAKLAALDAKVAEMDKAGEKVEPGFIPAGAEAAVLAASVADSQLPAAPEVVAEKPQQSEKSGWGKMIALGGVAIVACLVVAALIFR